MRQLPQRGLVLRHSLIEAPKRRKRGTQVGMDGGGLRILFQKFPILDDRSRKIARLLLLNRILHQLLWSDLRRLRRCRCAKADKAEMSEEKKGGSVHTNNADRFH